MYALVNTLAFQEGFCYSPDCGVEQLVARRAHNPEVAGSSPVPATSRRTSVSRPGFFSFRRRRKRNTRVVANSSPRRKQERRVLHDENHEGASFALCAGISRGGPGRAVTACLAVFTAGSPGYPRWPTGWAESLSGSLRGRVPGEDWVGPAGAVTTPGS